MGFVNACLRQMVGEFLPHVVEKGVRSSRFRMSIICAVISQDKYGRSFRCIVRTSTVRLFFLFMLAYLLSFSTLRAQEEPSKDLDTIVLTSGRKFVVRITSITQYNIYYKKPPDAEEFSFERKNVFRIAYSTGVVENMNERALESIDVTDWRAIILYENPDDVVGLYSHGMIYAESSKGAKSVQAAQRSAESKLQKRASARKAIAVLIHKRSTSGGYGEVPSYRIDGEAFGTEPLEEDFVDKEETTLPKKSKKKKKK